MTKYKNVPSAGPSITNEEIKLVTEAIREGWYENRNKHLNQFVSEFSKFIDKKYCLPVTNCTSAIHLALMSLNIGKGDEIIVPDITWVASVAPIHYVGATPVFADINEDDWCLSPESFEKRITPKTKAVIVVDLYGNMPQMDKILAIAKKHKLYVIEDAAEAIGAKYKNKNAGTFGDINVFSFNATKLMISGQGGMFATNNKIFYERAKRLSHHGMIKYSDKTTFWSVEIGYNYQWTNLHAAFALAQFRRLNELVEKRRLIFKWYYERLKNINGLALNYEAPTVFNTYWVVTAIVDKSYNLKKSFMMSYLSKYNIDTRPFFYPISSQPAYKLYNKDNNMKKKNPIAYSLSSRGISLPSAASLSENEVDFVCQQFKHLLKTRSLS